jgi:hypothetical protein
MNRTLSCALAALFSLLSGASLLAQGPITISVEPRVGALLPDRYLYEKYTNFSGDGPVEWTDGYLGRALVLGAGVEVGFAGGPVTLRGEVLRSFDQWVSVAHSIVMPRQLYTPPYVATTWVDLRAAVTTVSLQVVVPTRLTLWRVQPYVVAGFGGKHYQFGRPTTPADTSAILPNGGFSWGSDVGAGVTIPVAGLTLDLQARESITHYWGKAETDLIASGGVLWRVRGGGGTH